MMNNSYLAVGRACWSQIGPNKIGILLEFNAIGVPGQIRNSQTIAVNNSHVCVVGDLAEYPLLVLTFDIDPFFIVLNEVTIAMRAKADLIGAGIVVEPPQVERLETCFISSQSESERIERPTVL